MERIKPRGRAMAKPLLDDELWQVMSHSYRPYHPAAGGTQAASGLETAKR
jgi:hypothetical protein